MKLKNKKTGEILETARSSAVVRDKFRIFDENTNRYYTYSSLTELNAEWEDATEEPIQVYIEGIQNVYMGGGRVYIDYASAQEAEKALEKLRAWKRLKDKGFRVIDYGDEDIRYEIKDRYDGCLFDLETALFGGEE